MAAIADINDSLARMETKVNTMKDSLRKKCAGKVINGDLAWELFELVLEAGVQYGEARGYAGALKCMYVAAGRTDENP